MSVCFCASADISPFWYAHDEPAKLETEEGSLKLIYDEWLIVKLGCMSFALYARWSDTLQIIPLKIDNGC